MSSLNFWQAQLLALVSMTNMLSEGRVETSFMILPAVPIPQPPDSALTPATTTVQTSIASPLQCHLHNHGLFLSLLLSLCFLFSGLRRILWHGGILRTHCGLFHCLSSCLMHLFYLFNTCTPAPHLQYPSTETISDALSHRPSQVTLLQVYFPRMAFTSWKEHGSFILLIQLKWNILQK